MKKIYCLITFILTCTAFADSPENFYKLMEIKHASGTGVPGVTGSSITGAYAIKTNGYQYVEGQPYDANNGPYEFWSMNFGTHQSLRKFTLGVDGSDWSSYFDGYSWTSFYNGYGDYVDSNINNAGLDNLVGTSIIYATESDLGRISSGDPNFASGICSVYIGGALRAGAFVLNPAVLTFNGITYQPGQLALVTSISGTGQQFYRKVVLLYDLRQIGEYTDAQPDYDTGQDGLGNQTPVYGAFNQTDWNDSFYPLVTGQDILDTIPDVSYATTFNYGRQAIWAPDASAIYFAGFTANGSYDESDPNDFEYYNGIWKYDFADNQLKWIKREYTRENRMYYCEMAAIHTDVRDFTDDAETGIQILFSSETENVGGISCIVDNGQVNPPLYTVLDANQLACCSGKAAKINDIRNIVAVDNGDIYFYVSGDSQYIKNDFLYRCSKALYKYDTAGRLYAVSNRAHHMNFHYNNGSSISGSNGAMGAFQYYPNLFGKEMLTFRSTPLKVPCGSQLFEPLDFDHNGDVNIVDLRIFRDQRINNDRWLEPICSDDPCYAGDSNLMPGFFDVDANYINCDINGNSMYRSILEDVNTGEYISNYSLLCSDYNLANVLPKPLKDANDNYNYSVLTDKRYFAEKVVTVADAKVLYQFIPAGDASLDGKVNLIDFAAFAANFNTGNSTTNKKDFSQGDFDFDGDVDCEDLLLLSEFWLK